MRRALRNLRGVVVFGGLTLNTIFWFVPLFMLTLVGVNGAFLARDLFNLYVWFEVLLIFTFFIHMILMNFILGGSLLTVWDMLRGKLEKKASGSIPTLIALTVNFGVPPLLFVQVMYGHLFYSSSVMVAVPWILVIPILILVAAYGALRAFGVSVSDLFDWLSGLF